MLEKLKALLRADNWEFKSSDYGVFVTIMDGESLRTVIITCVNTTKPINHQECIVSLFDGFAENVEKGKRATEDVFNMVDNNTGVAISPESAKGVHLFTYTHVEPNRVIDLLNVLV